MTEITPIETSIKYLDDMALASGHPVLVTEAIFNIRTTITALQAERDELKAMIVELSNHDVSDMEAENALRSIGVSTWGPDGENFQRMFAIVMRNRSAELKRREAGGAHV